MKEPSQIVLLAGAAWKLEKELTRELSPPFEVAPATPGAIADAMGSASAVCAVVAVVETPQDSECIRILEETRRTSPHTPRIALIPKFATDETASLLLSGLAHELIRCPYARWEIRDAIRARLDKMVWRRAGGEDTEGEDVARRAIQLRASSGRPSSKEKSMAKTILLVDDTETVLLFENMMLRSTGHRLNTARNGLVALEAVQKCRPDLVLLDIMMPVLDGIETCRRLKEDPTTRSIPVVMVTTKGEPEMVEKAFRAGCDDYLTKPLNKLELVAKVRKYIGQ